MTALEQAQADTAAVAAYLATLTPAPPPTPTGVPSIPTVAPAGYSIVRSHNFAGLTALPSEWGAYAGEPGGDPDAEWLASHIIFNPDYLSLVTSGPGVLPDGSTGYTSAGIGIASDDTLSAGRTDVCVRFPSNAAGMSYIALQWNDANKPLPWPGGGEDDFVETNGSSPLAPFNVTSIYGGTPGSRAQQQTQVKVPAGFDWTAFHIWSIIRAVGARTYLVDGVVTATMTNTKFLLNPMNLDFQAQYLGNGTPTPPCPFDIAWAMEYALL